MRTPAWYAVLLALVGLERLRELAISKRHERARGGTRAASRTFPLMVAAHIGLFTLPLLEASTGDRRRPSLAWGAVLVAATGLRIWSIRSLGSAWNVRGAVPHDFVPVESGPYRYIRHPNYLAVILEFLAVPLIAGAWVSALLLSAVNAFVIADRIAEEERLLNQSSSYRRAFAQRARFVPHVF
jgi:methyltransferase